MRPAEPTDTTATISTEQQLARVLALLGDVETLDALNSQSNIKTPAKAAQTRYSLLLTRWIEANNDVTAQVSFSNDLKKTAQANPKILSQS